MTVDNAAIQTQSEKRSLRPGRAWLVLLGASLCIFAGNAAVPYYTFGVFLPEILADTGWSGPVVAAAVGPGLLAAAVMAPLAGMASDRFGVRSIILFGAPAPGRSLADIPLLEALRDLPGADRRLGRDCGRVPRDPENAWR